MMEYIKPAVKDVKQCELAMALLAELDAVANAALSLMLSDRNAAKSPFPYLLKAVSDRYMSI